MLSFGQTLACIVLCRLSTESHVIFVACLASCFTGFLLVGSFEHVELACGWLGFCWCFFCTLLLYLTQHTYFQHCEVLVDRCEYTAGPCGVCCFCERIHRQLFHFQRSGSVHSHLKEWIYMRVSQTHCKVLLVCRLGSTSSLWPVLSSVTSTQRCLPTCTGHTANHLWKR